MRLFLGIVAFILLFLLNFIFQGCSPKHRPPSTKRPQDFYHIVKNRENLFRIGKAYGIPYKRLARFNKITPPYQIQIGQKIYVPGAKRQLRVEIITPVRVTLKRPVTPRPKGKGREGFIWPIQGRITSKFGIRNRTFHDGIDIASSEKTPIKAVQSGQVIYSDRLRGYGKIIILQHANKIVTVYAHNKRNYVQEGQKITQGVVIGQVGSSGRVTGPHLHFEVRKNNIAQNPLYYLPKL